MKKVDIVLVGIGGYGSLALNELLNNNQDITIVGAVQRNINKHTEILMKLDKQKIPVFEKLEDFYENFKADLAIISTPIQYHCEQTCIALKNGSNVLCEKPACATIQEAIQMSETAKVNGKFVAIGYQLSYSDVILKLKKDIIEGVFGQPKRLKTLLLRPRSDKYYGRNNWAGKKKDPEGKWVLDSVAHNTGSHNIHNMLYMIGESISTSAIPVSVEAEIYKANPIDNFDTAIARVFTEQGVEILFYGTHASFESPAIQFIYEFEKGTIVHSPDIDKSINAYMNDGTVIKYGDPDTEPMTKLWTAIRATNGEIKIPCGIEAATAEILCINGIQDRVSENICFPEALVRYNKIEDEIFTYIEGIDNVMRQCYEKNSLPSEEKISWAKAASKVSLKNYIYFSGNVR